MAMDKEREALVERLKSLKVLLGTDSPEVRGWAPAVQQEAQKIVNATIAALTAQQEPVACCCGEPLTLGVVHRKDSPCFHWQNLPGTTQPADGVVSREEMIRAAKWLENAAAKSVSRREYLLAATALLAAAKELRK